MLTGQALGASTDDEARERNRIALYHFDPKLKLMSTADQVGDGVLAAYEGRAGGGARTLRNGAPPRTARPIPLDEARRRSIDAQVGEWSGEGMRLIAVARRPLADGPPPNDRDQIPRHG